MICEKCAKSTEDRRTVISTLGLWMRLCPACRERWAARDEKGEMVYFNEKKD